ncbi:MAG: Gfo/Idh/MocA family oxidoreductase [Chloroflexi bacterium]|nr:Gfo/Idh/MocA family oxidoreductase [Chloroflexota bacterium]
MASKIRWGILSTAKIGEKRVIPAMQASRNGEVAAVASRSLDKAKEFASRTGIPTAYGHYEELIAAPDIDAIYISVPNSEHARWSLLCAEAGKPTLCEKPLASDAAEAQAIVDAFASRNLLFAEAFMYRFHPQHQRVLDLIAAGEIGAIRLMSAAFSFAISREDDIRLQGSLAGGALMDVGCYCINALRLITGEEPMRGEALARFGGGDVDEVIAGVLEFPSGVVGHIDASLRAHYTNTYEVRGSEGRIVVEKAFVPHGQETLIRHWRGDQYSEYTLPPAEQYQLMAEDFADALLTGRAPRFPAQDAVENMRAIDRLLASARRHKNS